MSEGYRTVLFVTEGVVDSANETMNLFDCGVARSKAGLYGLRDEDHLGDFPLSWSNIALKSYVISVLPVIRS
jgi:hypothetical protein